MLVSGDLWSTRSPYQIYKKHSFSPLSTSSTTLSSFFFSPNTFAFLLCNLPSSIRSCHLGFSPRQFAQDLPKSLFCSSSSSTNSDPLWERMLHRGECHLQSCQWLMLICMTPRCHCCRWWLPQKKNAAVCRVVAFRRLPTTTTTVAPFVHYLPITDRARRLKWSLRRRIISSSRWLTPSHLNLIIATLTSIMATSRPPTKSTTTTHHHHLPPLLFKHRRGEGDFSPLPLHTVILTFSPSSSFLPPFFWRTLLHRSAVSIRIMISVS